jgi:hypothetical protein
MTHEELTPALKCSKSGSRDSPPALAVLLEAIDDGTAKKVAREIWETLQQDLEPPM